MPLARSSAVTSRTKKVVYFQKRRRRRISRPRRGARAWKGSGEGSAASPSPGAAGGWLPVKEPAGADRLRVRRGGLRGGSTQGAARPHRGPLLPDDAPTAPLHAAGDGRPPALAGGCA